jgi:hypothetical protein
MKLGYRPLELYYRKSKSRKIYIDAIKFTDDGSNGRLSDLIGKELTAF